MSSLSSSSSCSSSSWCLEFYDCVLNNDLARLEQLVEQNKIDLDSKFVNVRKKNHLDLSPIHLVAYKGYTGMLQYLKDMNCDIHQSTTTLRRTAFHFAVLRLKMACFHKLLSFGVDPDPRDTFGNTPSHYAAEEGAVEILDVLLTRKININAQDITSKTPLMKATRNGKVNAVRRLIKANALLNICDRNMDTALHFAARQGSELLVAALIEAGADVNLKNHWGHTPLFEAVNYNNKSAAVKLLSVANCNVNASDNKTGDTTLHVAIRKNYIDLVNELIKTGQVLVDKYNRTGESPIYDAIINNKLDTLKNLLKYNYNFDAPARLDVEGNGNLKSVMKLALERNNILVMQLLSNVGYVITTDGDNQAFQKLSQIIPPVRQLKQLCRKAIRQCLGFGIRWKMVKLGLPITLQSYLLLDDILADDLQFVHVL